MIVDAEASPLVYSGSVERRPVTYGLYTRLSHEEGKGKLEVLCKGHSGSHSLHFVMARRQGIMKI